MTDPSGARSGDDLDTLLGDAGRAPTIDLDVDAVHARGRRRALVRRAAAGVGALALVGATTLAAVALVGGADAPVIDQAPSEAPTGTPSRAPSADDEHTEDRVAPTAAMADLGVTAVDVVRSQDGAGGLHVRVVTADGVVEEFSTAAGSLPPASGNVVVTEDLQVWFDDVDANLLVGGPEDPLGGPGLLAQDGVGWAVLGASAEGLPLVTQAAGVGAQLPADLEREVFEVHAQEDSPDDGFIEGIPGIFGTFQDMEGQPFSADAAPERLALLHGTGERQTATLHLAGAGAVVLAETSDPGVRLVDVAIVDDEVWVVAQEDGATNLWIAAMDGDPVGQVATPVGRTRPGVAVELEVETGDAGSVAVLSTVAPDGSHGPAYRVDVAGARSAATTEQVTSDTPVPSGVYDVLDAAGTVHLLPPPETGDAPAACADGPVLNPPPGFELAVWFLCWDAVDQLPDRAAHPFVHGEDRFAGAEVVAGADGIQAVLEAWAAGPTAAEAARGLTGGLDPATADLNEVVVDGTTVTVDLAAGPQVGVLGATTGRATTVQAIVGAVLQFDGYGDLQVSEVVITLDGSCEDWAALAQAEGCPTYDETDAPWWTSPAPASGPSEEGADE